MKNYYRILMACAAEMWAMDRDKMAAVLAFLEIKALGDDVDPEEVARLTQKAERETAATPGAVGVLPLVGVMGHRMNMMENMSGGTSTQMVAKHFRQMMADPQVKAIVLDVDSPGGVVAGTQELADEIYHSRGVKPIVAQVDTVAASAAYWAATAADEVVVTPSGRAGSVGVYTIHEDVSKMLDRIGVKKTAIASSDTKVQGMPFEPLSEEARAAAQARVNALNDKFVAGLARNRRVSQAKVRDQFGNGATFFAEELVSRGMADRVATMDETLERFGVQLNPAASRGRAAERTRAEMLAGINEKLRGGERLTERELQNLLQGTAGLSKREAVKAVEANFTNAARGTEQPKTETKELSEAMAAIRQTLDRLSVPTGA